MQKHTSPQESATEIAATQAKAPEVSANN